MLNRPLKIIKANLFDEMLQDNKHDKNYQQYP